MPTSELTVELGQGGMGSVSLLVAQGADGALSYKVVKRLREDLSSNDYFVKMFFDEGRLAVRLVHPNVVRMTLFGFDGRHYFIEMEYLEGQALGRLLRGLRPQGGLPLPLLGWVLREILTALHYCHELADDEGRPLFLVHRDISPSNIFVTYDGAVKLLDFGIAKATLSLSRTRTGDLKGKVAYMSPEQAALGEVDRRVDVFAVGVIMWEALANRPLWRGAKDSAILQALRTGEIPSLAAARPDLPAELVAICTRALERNPEDRWATALEFRDALAAYSARHGEQVGPTELSGLMMWQHGEARATMRAAIDDWANLSPDARAAAVTLSEASPEAPSGGSGVSSRDEKTTAERVTGDTTRRRRRRRLRTRASG
jgi:serine/threonine protein kinase